MPDLIALNSNQPDSMYGSDARYFTLLQAHDAKVALNEAARAKLIIAEPSCMGSFA